MHRGGLVGGEAFSIDASLIKADVDKKKRSGGDQPIDWPTPEEASHAVREYLAALDAARRDEESGGGDGSGSGGSGGGKPAKQISLTDPQAAWVARKGVDPFFAYDANYLIDNGERDHPRRRMARAPIAARRWSSPRLWWIVSSAA